MLRRFLVYPELTPMQKAWQKAGERVDRTPVPDESIFFNNSRTDTEDDDSEEEKDSDEYGDTEEDEDTDEGDGTDEYGDTDEPSDDTYESDKDIDKDDHDRGHRFHTELQKAKPLAHPFRRVLEALGVETNPLFAALGLGVSVPHSFEGIENYPFPTTATVLNWPCLSDFHELEPSEISDCFWEELGHILHLIKVWREVGEEELVEWWESGTELTDNLANPIVKIRGSTDVTATLSSNLRLLLRADTAFSYTAPGTPGGQGAHLHYPHYYHTPDDCPAHGSPRSMNSARMYRHLEAEGITKALLHGLGMPDVAYIQLLLMGASLVCGRCDDNQPRTWDQIIDHYRQEAQHWTNLQGRTPEFETKRPPKFANVHDLNSISSPKPFVQRLIPQEIASLTNSSPLDVKKSFCCILCRNHQVCHAFKKLTLVSTHMNDVHGIANAVSGLHYTSHASSASFSSWGKKWSGSWDAHQAAHEWEL
ncbi:hypothetical protein FRC08_013313 [Ceratobasidium sp. 394]|nr:hypothetical protein FRC08_013313 [Ceratobasidium sp. 394]